MIVMSHRGYWKESKEKNSYLAFERSFSLGFGTETDIRDFCGELVISHDIADATCLKVELFFELYCAYNRSLPLALNIKADGLQDKLKCMLVKYNIENYFVFDMSVPEGLRYLLQGCRSFTRQSEYEKVPSFYMQAAGVWLDEFHGHWITEEIIYDHKKNGKEICIVSPDLHGRSCKKEWEHYRKIENDIKYNNIMICTDDPEGARLYFGEN